MVSSDRSPEVAHIMVLALILQFPVKWFARYNVVTITNFHSIQCKWNGYRQQEDRVGGRVAWLYGVSVSSDPGAPELAHFTPRSPLLSYLLCWHFRHLL